MENFTPILSTIGGILIGLSAAGLMLLNGRIAGISGIFEGVLVPARDGGWKYSFVTGLVAGGLAMAFIRPELFAVTIERSWPLVAAAGFLVGFGTRLGNGCTSGHGVCGMARLSKRSIVATLTFMAFGIGTVYLTEHLLGVGA